MREFDQIKALREEYCGLKDSPRESLANSVKILADDLYAKDTHFIFELVQNAEDNDYQPQIQPWLRFEVSQQEVAGKQQTALAVHNNEVGFQEKHVRAICQVGKSTKNKALGYIGEKGIGFKSVFRITNCPYVFSNGFRFCLPEQDEETGLGYIVPQWVEKPPAGLTEKKETTIILPLNKSPKDVRSVSKALREIAPETILFLQKLTSLEISIRLPEEEYEVVAEKRILRESGASRLVELSYLQRGKELEEEVVETARYWLTEQEFRKPSEIQHEKRLNIETRTVSVAIPLDQGVHPGKLFAYLPVWEQTGLPFLVNADFLLVSSREGIREDEDWNLWLRDCVAVTYTTAFLALLADSQLSLETRISAYAAIPIETHHQFLNPIVETINEHLAESACILTLPDEKPVKPEQARLCHKTIRTLFGQPADYPQYLREKIRLVCLEMEAFEEQLQEVGVKKFLLSDVTACLEDSAWVQGHPYSWLVELFRFLKKQKLDPGKLSHIHLIPIDQGKTISFSCIQDQPIYFAHDLQQSKDLAKIPQWLSSLAKIAFVHCELQAQLTAQPDCKDLTDWLTNQLDIHPFSIANYCVDILDAISVEYENLPADKLADVARFLLDNADKKTFNWNTFPVALADGRKMLLEDIRNLTVPDSREKIQAIVVPENYDPKAGWQHIWKTQADRAHFVVLAEQYSLMPLEWFSCLGVKHYPLFREVQWQWWQVPKDFAYFNESYLADRCYQKAAQSRAGETTVSSYEIPSTLAGGRCSKETSNTLVGFLETLNKSSCCFEAIGRYQNYGTCSDRSPSSLLKKMCSIPWLPTSKGLVAPKEAFLPKPGIKEVLGSTVPYFAGDFPEHVLELLGVQSEVSVEKLLGILSNNSGRKIGLELPRRIYKELANRANKGTVGTIQSAFASTALIFDNSGGPDSTVWRKKEECIWEDASGIIGNDFAYLGSLYPHLKDFFVDTVGIKVRLDTECFANRLLTLQEEPLSETEQQRQLVERIYRELKPLTKKPENERPAWWGEFSRKIKLYSQSDRFCDPEAIFIPDDGELRRIFEKHDEVEFVWRPGDDSFNDWLPFYKAFNAPLLSESVTEDLKECASSNLLEKNRFVTIAAVRMIAVWLREKKRADYDRLLAHDVFRQLFSIREASSSESILVEYQLETNSYLYNPKSEYYPVFWDDSGNILYYTNAPQKIKIAKALAKKLIASYSELAHWIELVLEAPDTKRLQHENWSVPREILAMCDKGISAIPQNISGNPAEPADNDAVDDELKMPSNGDTAILGRQEIPHQSHSPGASHDTDKPANQKSGNIYNAGIISASPETTSANDSKNDLTGNVPPVATASGSCACPTTPQDGTECLFSPADFGDGLREAFSKDGATEINDEFGGYGENSVKNPGIRGARVGEKFRDAIKNEPSPESRRHPRENSPLEGPSEEVRSSLFAWYHGKCQICGNTWPKRNGEPYFAAAYLVHRRHARFLDNPGNALCLCAEHFAQWQYAAKEPTDDIVTQIARLRLQAEGGGGNLFLGFRMLNVDCAINYDERHFLGLRVLLSLTEDVEANNLSA